MSKMMLDVPPLPNFVTIGRTRFEPGEQHPNRRSIGVFDWLFVIEGELYIGEDEQRWEVCKGQTLLLLPDRSHYATAPCRNATVFYWIHFEYHGSYSAGGEPAPLPIRHAWSNPHKLGLSQHASPRHFSRIELLLERLLEASTAGNVSYWREQQQFMEILHALEEEDVGQLAPSSVLKLAKRTEAYLRQHYRNEISNETLAEALHFHPNYIARCMKDIYGCTPMDYLMQYRIEQACLLLIKTELPVAAVAERVGFQYAPYFSNCFKRRIGVSPLAFRRRHS